MVGRLSIPASSRAVGRHWGAAGAFGFVATADPGGDLYLPSRALAGARHGDLVLARELGSARASRTQGAVVAILKRAPSRFAAEIVVAEGKRRVRPRDDRVGVELPLDSDVPDRPRLESEEGFRRRREHEAARDATARGEGGTDVEARPGDLVMVEAATEGMPRARVIEVIGRADDPSAAERMIRADMGLPGPFPAEAESEAERAVGPIAEDDLRGREEFRSQTVVTIDPADARDFDDAIAAEPLPDGMLRLWVHIADVARYVSPGGALDREACARGTSVYFPGQVIPMLPHALSSGICSLKEGEDRLVQSVAIDYTREAKVTGVRFADGVIRSAARLTYEEAAGAMEDPGRLRGRGDAGVKVANLLALLAPLARRLTETRIARGALDLDLPEVEFDPGKGGLPAALRAQERTAAHRLIEEFMLAANEAVARHLSEKGIPSIYRVHEPPEGGDVEEVEETLAPLGAGRKGGRSLAARLQHLLSRFRGRPEEGIVARHVLRAMKIARYADARGDHFGLALRHYTHFTSPIRRYPDLMVHRILRAARGAGEEVEKGRRARSLEDEAGRLSVIASESSRLERRAEEAERAVNDLIIARHMKDRVGQIFEGMVSGAVRGGVFVAIRGKDLEPGIVEGFAPTARAKEFVLTEAVRVRLEECDLLRGRLRLSLVQE